MTSSIAKCIFSSIIQLLKYSSSFPQSVIIFISLVRLIFVVTEMKKPQYVKKSVSFHCIAVKCRKKGFCCGPIGPLENVATPQTARSS
jgi:hypothetical protein